MYRIPKEIQSDIQITKLITLDALVFGGIFLALVWGFGSLLVHSFYQIPYWIFSTLMMFHLLTRVKGAAKARRFETYFFYLIRKRSVRHALVKEEGVNIEETT